MTRINTIEPADLLDQHLFAEYREITRIASTHKYIPVIPSHYLLGSGHMKFFYDKGLWLYNRLEALKAELAKRNRVRFTDKTYTKHIPGYNNDWQPDLNAHVTNIMRLDERLRQKPDFYTLNGKPVSISYYLNLVTKYKELTQ